MHENEIVNVLNERGEVVDTVTREEADDGNHTIDNVIVFLFNSVGKVWIQLRPQSKKHFPGLWDVSACGGVDAREDKDEAAARETREETGLEVDLRYCESFVNTFTGPHGSETKRFSHLYIGQTEEIPQENDEVDEFKLVDQDWLIRDVEQNPANYIPSFLIEISKAVEYHKNYFV